MKRLQGDFRVSEVLDRGLVGGGEFQLYQVTKRGLTTFEAADVLAREAGVAREEVSYAGLKDKDGITGQYMTVKGGQRVNYKDGNLTIRPVGRAGRAMASEDNLGNAFEIVLRDLTGDDMRRVRVNLDQVRKYGLPAYYDDQRFGCLRHGQGFVVRQLLRGDLEGAARSLTCAPSPYGSEPIERYKQGIARRWGDWGALAEYCAGRRGATLFAYLRDRPGDWSGALTLGISSRERNIHLYAYQSHLWNRAAALWLRNALAAEQLAWLPGDDGALPVYRVLSAEQFAELGAASLPLYGAGAALSGPAQRHYEAVFRSEGVEAEAYANLDLPGFRPQYEERPLILQPQFLRAAPAERDEIYKKRHKMRVRFTLPRGHYATLVTKRLVMPTEAGAPPPKLWVSRHPLMFPDGEGRAPSPFLAQRRKPTQDAHEGSSHHRNHRR